MNEAPWNVKRVEARQIEPAEKIRSLLGGTLEFPCTGEILDSPIMVDRYATMEPDLFDYKLVDRLEFEQQMKDRRLEFEQQTRDRRLEFEQHTKDRRLVSNNKRRISTTGRPVNTALWGPLWG